MTEHQIELAVERKMEALDRIYLKDDFTITTEEYQIKIKEIDDWAKEQLANLPLNY